MLKARNLGKLSKLKNAGEKFNLNKSTKVMPINDGEPPRKRMFAVDMLKKDEEDERKSKMKEKKSKLGGFSWSTGKNKFKTTVETKETKETKETNETNET
jgi:hypothetical protein